MKPLDWFKAFALLCLGALLFSVTVVVWQNRRLPSTTAREVSDAARELTATLKTFQGVGPQATATLKTLQATGRQASKTLQAVKPVLDRTATALDGVNRPCNVAGKPCGTLADVNRTLATVRGTFGQIETAARHETRNLDEFDEQERRVYDDIHQTTANLNSLIASPDIARFLKSSADTSMEVAAIAKDVHKEADSLVAPVPWWHKIGNYTTTGVNIACLVTHSCPF